MKKKAPGSSRKLLSEQSKHDTNDTKAERCRGTAKSASSASGDGLRGLGERRRAVAEAERDAGLQRRRLLRRAGRAGHVAAVAVAVAAGAGPRRGRGLGGRRRRRRDCSPAAALGATGALALRASIATLSSGGRRRRRRQLGRLRAGRAHGGVDLDAGGDLADGAVGDGGLARRDGVGPGGRDGRGHRRRLGQHLRRGGRRCGRRRRHGAGGDVDLNGAGHVAAAGARDDARGARGDGVGARRGDGADGERRSRGG